MIRFPAGYDSLNRIKRYQDYYQASYGVMLLSAGQFSPLSLFAAGEQGAWYDPSDFTTMFTDAAGTTPVTSVEQPVGLLLDKSKGLALGAELVTNGDFSSGTTGWSPANASITIAAVGGAGEMTSSAANIYVSQTINVTSGKTYLVTGQGRAGTAPLLPLAVSGSATLGAQINSSGSMQPISFIFVAGAATASIRFQVQSGSGGTAYFDNISVRELPGNHASQSTAASRPVLSARVNLLTYSEQFDNAAWTKAAGVTVSANTDIAPDGTLTADTLTSSGNQLDQSVSCSTNTVYTNSLYFKKTSGAAYQPAQYLLFSGGTFVIYAVRLNTDTGVATAVSAGGFTAPSSFAVQDAGQYWRLSITGNSNNNTTASFRLYVNLSAGGGAGAGSQIIWGADLRVTNVGVNLPAYQRVGAATDYDTSGFPLYLKFDGVDDSLATGTIDPGAVDKAQVFAGVRKINTSSSVLAELSADITANNGSFVVNSPASSGFTRFASKGTTLQFSDGSDVSPNTVILSGLSDISGDLVKLRLNGVQVAQNTGDQGTGNYLAYPLYIGRRNNSTLPFNGNLYSMILRFSAANLSDAQIASTETYVNNLTKAY